LSLKLPLVSFMAFSVTGDKMACRKL
jgi:hypothetical protein